MADTTAEIIPFPTRAKPLRPAGNFIEQLYSHELLFTAGTLINRAIEGYAVSTDTEFYGLVEAAHLALERLLLEGGRIS